MSLLREVLEKWSRDQALTQGAALAYYAMFSLAPLSVLVVAIVGAVVGEPEAHRHLVARFEAAIGSAGAATLEELIGRANRQEIGGIATLVALGTMILGASGIFGQLQSAFDAMWGVPPADLSWRTLARDRLYATGMIVVVGALLMLSLASDTAMAALEAWITVAFPVAARVVPPVHGAVSFLLTSASFAILFKWVPQAAMDWRDVWIGGAVTAALFALGRRPVAWYLATASTTSVYGAAGSLVLVLLWIYYSAQILLLGAEFTEVWSRRRGSRRSPDG
jgi:membrane protein